ncbi:MAG: DUF4407 domain-containing protein [Bacteroidota bacterium]
MLNKLRNFFWICSGVVIENIKKIETDHVKYASIGATVFFTGLLASLSGGYAMHYVFNNYWVTIPFAILWGLIIFNLDRYIVSSLIKPRTSGKGAFVDFMREIPPAIPRFLLASVIAIAVSNPIELRLFEKEINTQISEDLEKFKIDYNQNSIYKKEISKIKLDQKSEKISTDLSAKEAQIASLENDYVKEIQGITGTKKYGYGIAAKTIESTLNKLRSESDSIKKAYVLKDTTNQAKIGKLELDHATNYEIELKNRTENVGFLARNVALGKLQDKSPVVWATSWFLRLLFLILEISPLLVKLLSPKGIYDYQLEKTLEDEKSKSSLFLNDLDLRSLDRLNQKQIFVNNLESTLLKNNLDDRIEIVNKLKEYIESKLTTVQKINDEVNKKPIFSTLRIKNLLENQAEKTIDDLLNSIDDDEWWRNLNLEFEKYKK